MDNTFCIVPWFEIHINADGSYHTCGAQPDPIIGTAKSFEQNVTKLTIPEWINSQHQKTARIEKLCGEKNILCRMCYYEEAVGTSSKRQRENFKSKIDSKHFTKSFDLSPHKPIFLYSKANQGKSNFFRPTSYHISIGNECNLACLMCVPGASSKVASERLREGSYSGPIRMNWTDNKQAWDYVVNYMCETEDLQFVHIIGGEPILQSKFADLVERLVASNRTDIYLGFTTNGTYFDHSLLDKLNHFRHVDIGISIETADIVNDYIRQGSQYMNVLENIKKYLQYRSKEHVYVTVRPTPNALSVHTFDSLMLWCIENKVDIMTNFLTFPSHLQIKNLPQDIKDRLIKKYSAWQPGARLPGIGNPRDPHRYREHIDDEISAIIKSLQQDNDQNETDKLYVMLDRMGWLANPTLSQHFVIN